MANQGPENMSVGRRPVKGENIAQGLLEFACEIIRVVRDLRRDVVSRHAARQIARAGTAGGANYEEARCAESRADFAHKCSIAGKEVREAVYWLRLVQHGGLCNGSVVDLRKTIAEGTQLAAILYSSARTARRGA